VRGRGGGELITGLSPVQERELAELQEFLGADYDESVLVASGAAVQEERERAGSEDELYRTSHAYLYDLTVFAMSRTKAPYLEALRRLVPPGAHLLDYGCGIGSDGIELLEQGYRVSFVDFDNPSTRYLRWRLERRGLDAHVYDLDRDELPGGFDAVYSFDVIEHVDDPFDFLEQMERRGRLVVVNFLVDDPDEDENALHRELPLNALLARAAAGRLRHYGRYHGRSHLVLYEPGQPSPAIRLRSRAELLRGRTAAWARDTRRLVRRP
jgi:SAM-dependent methyltransferase